MVKRAILRAGVASVALMGASISTVSAEPLEVALNRLLDQHPRIQSERARLESTRAAVQEADGFFLPTATLSAETGPERVSNVTTRNSNSVDTLPSKAATLEVRQPLFTGYRNENERESRQIVANATELSLSGVMQRTMLDGVSDYLNVLRVTKLIEIARAREETILTQMQLEDESVRRGSGITVDVLQAKSRLQVAIEQRVALQGDLEAARAGYIESFGLEPNVPEMSETFFPEGLLPYDVEEAVNTAMENSPQFQSTTLLTKAREAITEVQRAGYLPTLDLVGSARYEEDLGGVREIDRTYAVLLEMRWEIFSGFRTDAVVKQALDDYARAKADADNTLRDVEKRVRETWARLENTRERMTLLYNAVAIAVEVFEARKRLREAGKETALNVLDAEDEVFQAEQNLIRAEFDNSLASFQLAEAMGVLTPASLGLSDPLSTTE